GRDPLQHRLQVATTWLLATFLLQNSSLPFASSLRRTRTGELQSLLTRTLRHYNSFAPVSPVHDQSAVSHFDHPPRASRPTCEASNSICVLSQLTDTLHLCTGFSLLIIFSFLFLT
ncbi:unnamed protein product, partial [Ixodes persulcatus]